MSEEELAEEMQRLKCLESDQISMSMVKARGVIYDHLLDRNHPGHSQAYWDERERSNSRALSGVFIFALIAIPAVIAGAIMFGR